MKWIIRIIGLGFVGFVLMVTIGTGGVYIEDLEYEVSGNKPELISYEYEKISLEEVPEEQISYLIKYSNNPEEELIRLQEEQNFVKVTYQLRNPSNTMIELGEGYYFYYSVCDNPGYVNILRKDLEDSILDRYDNMPVLPAGETASFVEYISVPKEAEQISFYPNRDRENEDRSEHLINL